MRVKEDKRDGALDESEKIMTSFCKIFTLIFQSPLHTSLICSRHHHQKSLSYFGPNKVNDVIFKNINFLFQPIV